MKVKKRMIAKIMTVNQDVIEIIQKLQWHEGTYIETTIIDEVKNGSKKEKLSKIS